MLLLLLLDSVLLDELESDDMLLLDDDESVEDDDCDDRLLLDELLRLDSELVLDDETDDVELLDSELLDDSLSALAAAAKIGSGGSGYVPESLSVVPSPLSPLQNVTLTGPTNAWSHVSVTVVPLPVAVIVREPFASETSHPVSSV